LGSHVLVEPDVRRAVERARRLAGVRGLVCVTGSLYMVGQAREMWVPTQAILEQRTSFPRLG
jgi:folylpolyglutamate synthase/dihydropteroate synthase